ncbi:unnamed protein product [Acanthoscelides obtectus]|uniref:J domain-containing protein n=1 Tax=Acanthoscelides obtectus TaxID=200917 RepID=A0A9P0KXX0_ACAOB|nr:unnamed protein product [Acanthoscelides obtectus]CAK1620144.1 DnaJ homolog subfamily B member 6 [Acanthoscelides obtectus]
MKFFITTDVVSLFSYPGHIVTSRENKIMLQVPVSASLEDIKKAYKQLALKWHPDKNPDRLEEANRNFRNISKAYEVLSDKATRDIHDMRNGGYPPRKYASEQGFCPYGMYGFDFKHPEMVFKEFFHGSMLQFHKVGKFVKVPSRNPGYDRPWFRDLIFPRRRHDMGDYEDEPFVPPYAYTPDSCLFGNVYGFQSVGRPASFPGNFKERYFKMKNTRI